MRTKILNTVSDLVSDFMYYDRKEDEDLSAEDLIGAVNSGEVTVDEIVDHFKRELAKNF